VSNTSTKTQENCGATTHRMEKKNEGNSIFKKKTGHSRNCSFYTKHLNYSHTLLDALKKKKEKRK
jgi:hypothetical protein